MSDYIIPVQRIETINVNDLCHQAADERRAQIVEWLRAGAGNDTSRLDVNSRDFFMHWLNSCADAIECGEYLKPTSE